MSKEKNFLQLDIDDITPVEVSKNEKQKVIKTILQKQFLRKKKIRKWTIASILAIGICSASLVNFPSMASILPIKDVTLSEKLFSKQHEFIFNRISISENTATIYFSCNLDFATEFITLDIVDNFENYYYDTSETLTNKITDNSSNGKVILNHFEANASSIFITPIVHTMDKEGNVTKERLETIEIKIDSNEK
ncbi:MULTISPECIES: hypothetical protein [Lysinibacillus]|uniref:hypothetical protein n=1 Tax=Lysinibacillus TaxID=400634 RepID=UPI00257E66D8|nr:MULTISPECIES: hypothetical protein [Lysinibacillus]